MKTTLQLLRHFILATYGNISDVHVEMNKHLMEKNQSYVNLFCVNDLYIHHLLPRVRYNCDKVSSHRIRVYCRHPVYINILTQIRMYIYFIWRCYKISLMRTCSNRLHMNDSHFDFINLQRVWLVLEKHTWKFTLTELQGGLSLFFTCMLFMHHLKGWIIICDRYKMMVLWQSITKAVKS